MTSVFKTLDLLLAHRIRTYATILLLALVTAASSPAVGQPGGKAVCRIDAVEYKGWQAQQISNRWVQLAVVPQNGGRLIQVTFGGHPYLFVNPKYAGKYLPPSSSQWFNYGGDKVWLLPEGNNDEQHWVGNSDILDDGPFTLRKVSEGDRCEIELTGPADPQTGIQLSRTIRLEADAPVIHFHAVMKNVTGHPIEWSMQSVSQYDTSGLNSPSADGVDSGARFNRDFRTFTPANPHSSYLNRYHVRFGPAENPAASVRDDGLFTVHYVHMAAELWIDSLDGWLAVVDGKSRYAMVERFRYDETKPYPGKASVIFWTNGPELRLSHDGIPSLSADSDAIPYYLEAELNSPMCRLLPGESCSFETEWFPTRSGDEFHGATDPGIVIHPLQAARLENGQVKLTGSFGAFYPGNLVARFYDEHGAFTGKLALGTADPTQPVSLNAEVSPPERPARISLHLEDESGVDRGSFQEIPIAAKGTR